MGTKKIFSILLTWSCSGVRLTAEILKDGGTLGGEISRVGEESSEGQLSKFSRWLLGLVKVKNLNASRAADFIESTFLG